MVNDRYQIARRRLALLSPARLGGAKLLPIGRLGLGLGLAAFSFIRPA